MASLKATRKKIAISDLSILCSLWSKICISFTPCDFFFIIFCAHLCVFMCFLWMFFVYFLCVSCFICFLCICVFCESRIIIMIKTTNKRERERKKILSIDSVVFSLKIASLNSYQTLTHIQCLVFSVYITSVGLLTTTEKYDYQTLIGIQRVKHSEFT